MATAPRIAAARRDDGEGEDAIGSELQQLQRAVLGAPNVASGTFDGDADLAKSDPGAQPAQVPVMFRHRADFVDDAARHEAKIAGIQGQLDRR